MQCAATVAMTHLLFSTSPILPTLAPLCVRERAVCPPGASSMLSA